MSGYSDSAVQWLPIRIDDRIDEKKGQALSDLVKSLFKIGFENKVFIRKRKNIIIFRITDQQGGG